MSVGVLLPLVAFFVMGVVVVAALWRVMVVGGELRRQEQRARAAVDIACRAEASLAELCAVVDELRRRRSTPESAAPSLRASADALREYAQEADATARKEPGPEVGTSLVAEIERARRAVDLVEHGRQMMLEGSVDDLGEGETEVKRGYLNLLHAKDAIRVRGQQIARETSQSPDWPDR
jgi:multidrug efflux pump subunit AcrB